MNGLTVSFDENGKMAVESQAKAGAAVDGTTGSSRIKKRRERCDQCAGGAKQP